MTRFFKGIAISAALILASCSGGGGGKNPPPAPTNPVWAISSFTASDTEAFVGNAVTLTATVTKDGTSAPDGTTVEFTVAGEVLSQITTSDGSAITAFVADVAGSYICRAKVVNVTSTITVVVSEHEASDTLKILPPLMPDRGAYAGGEQVMIKGEAVVAPVEVDFTVSGVAYPAEVVNVQESDPLSAEGSITIRTPAITAVDQTVSLAADLTVRSGVDTAGVQTATIPAAFTYLAEQALEVYQPFEPNNGSYEGAQQIVIRGRGIKAPAEVKFLFAGEEFLGLHVSVVESNPSTAEGSISFETPYIPENLRPAPEVCVATPSSCYADVEVTVLADSADAMTSLVPSAFSYIGNQGWSELGEPIIYLVNPNFGSPSGGEQITILGRNFRGAIHDANGEIIDTPVALQDVFFINSSGGELPGQVQSVSADGTQAVVLTPRFSTIPLSTQALIAVRVETAIELSTGVFFPDVPYTYTLTNSFVLIPDEPTPEISAIAPTGGPIDGGTEVTIFGHGFQTPAQVTFGNLEAINVQVTDDQTISDQDQIVCVTPDYSQQGEEPPVAVSVQIRNVNSGNVSNTLNYTYGDNLFISSNAPVEGGPGDSVVIYGSGFEAPLHLDFVQGGTTKLLAGDIRLDLLSVSGTEILARFPVDTPVACANVDGAFRVTLVESSDIIEGGAFTYLGSTPHIYGVEPIFVQETSNGAGVTPTDITIHGEFFNPDLIVEIEGFRMANSMVDVVSPIQIDVTNIPAPNDFGIKWDQTPCVTDTGLTGIRRTSTPVDVTVTNLPGDCSETLAGGLVYEPEQPVECIVSPLMTVTAPDFPDAEAGSCSVAQPLTIFNGGGGTLEITSMTLQGPFQFAAAPVLPLTVAPFTSDSSVTIQFCPTADDGTAQPGQLIMVSNDPSSPTTVPLVGQEAFPVIATTDLTMSCAAGSTCAGTITISNAAGSQDLTWTEAIAGDAELTVAASDGAAPASGTGTITIQMDATAAIAGGQFAATVTVTADQSDAQGSPATVQVTGNVI